jgi:hypothetical protein
VLLPLSTAQTDLFFTTCITHPLLLLMRSSSQALHPTQSWKLVLCAHSQRHCQSPSCQPILHTQSLTQSPMPMNDPQDHDDWMMCQRLTPIPQMSQIAKGSQHVSWTSELGRPGCGGYNLGEAINWDPATFRKLKVRGF